MLNHDMIIAKEVTIMSILILTLSAIWLARNHHETRIQISLDIWSALLTAIACLYAFA